MKRARSFHVTAVSLPISQRGAQRTAQEPPRRFPTQVSRSFPDALVKTQITAGNRTPISALKESSSFHGRHTDTSEAANALNERGKAKILLQAAPPLPPSSHGAPPQEVTTNTPLSKAEQPLSANLPPPPPAPPGCAIRERGGEAPLIPCPNAAQERCRHARPYVSLAPAQHNLPRRPARPPPPHGTPQPPTLSARSR